MLKKTATKPVVTAETALQVKTPTPLPACIVAPNQDKLEKINIAELKAVPSIVLVTANTDMFKKRLGELGEFFDLETGRSLGNQLTIVQLGYAHRYEAKDKERNSLKLLYYKQDEEINDVAVSEMLETYKDKNKYSLSKGVVLLVYLPELGLVRRLWCKGMLNKGGLKCVNQSFLDGQHVALDIETRYNSGKGNEWYELDVNYSETQTDYPNRLEFWMDLFVNPKWHVDEEETVQNTEPTKVLDTGRKI